jgi:adenosylcobinamide-GDP ribazoletransferase
VKSLLAALQFLTIFPWPARPDGSAREIGPAAIYFPVVGFGLGAILFFLNSLLEEAMPDALLSLTLVAALTLLTRGLHLDGLADTFDGLGAGGDRERTLKIMDDSHSGVFGVVAVVLVLLFKFHAIESMTEERGRALLIAPLLGRWAMVALAYRSKAAKEGLGSFFAGRVSGCHLFFATLIALVSVAGFSQGFGLAVMAGVAISALAAKSYFHRRLGGLTGDVFGAVGELSEITVLAAFALRSW